MGSGSEGSRAGGVITSAAEMGGGGGIRVELAPVDVVLAELTGSVERDLAECVCESCCAGFDCPSTVPGCSASTRGGSVAGESESESSFSQTISGVQIRSGRESTTSGGARSASRCLNSQLRSFACHHRRRKTEWVCSPGGPNAV
jgi:hypothetical protein